MSTFITAAEACHLLLNEKVIAVPTETVYGLAALATSQVAIEKIYKIKNRPADNPLICHFHDFHQAVSFLKPFPEYVDVLQRYFSPGPLSYLLPLKENSSLKHAVRNQANVIVRIPAHPVLLEILKCVDQPLAAPSANTSGKYSPTNAQMVADDIGDKVDGIVDGGSSISGIESTIIDCTNPNQINILRPGSIGKKDIEEVLKQFGINIPVEYSKSLQPTPGNIYRHYAPQTPVTKINVVNEIDDDLLNKAVLLSDNDLVEANSFFSNYTNPPKLLSYGSATNPSTIAHQLYCTLSELDKLKVDHAYILYPDIKDTDWQKAIYYRLDKMTEKF